MRKITSKYKQNKIKKRNQWIVGFILIFLMLVSTLGFAFQGGFSEKREVLKYNDFEFEKVNDLWKIGDFVFRNHPSEVPDFGNLIFKNIQDYSNKQLYIYSEDEIAQEEILINLGRFVERTQKACYKGKTCDLAIPIKTCEDNFIIIEINEDDRIYSENNCVFIQGKKENLIKLSDSFLFKILGVK